MTNLQYWMAAAPLIGVGSFLIIVYMRVLPKGHAFVACFAASLFIGVYFYAALVDRGIANQPVQNQPASN